MSHCKEIREKLSAFIDGELPPLERSLIEKHLQLCLSCAQEKRSLQKISDLLDEIPDESPHPVFASLTVRRAASWKRYAYIKEHFYRPAIALLLSGIAFIVHPIASGVSMKRHYPAYRYLRNFDDFPPESLASIYMMLIEGECR